MSQADLRKWDSRYRDGSYSDRRHPTALLERFINGLPRGSALDIACGAGRNSLLLAESGFDVDAVDISAAGLERLRADAQSRDLQVRTHEADLEEGIPAGLSLKGDYELILMVRYVNQPLVKALVERLAHGGIFICEQHLKTDSDVVGPRSEAFRLAANELLNAASTLRVLYYREGLVADPDGRMVALAQIVASQGGTSLVVD